MIINLGNGNDWSYSDNTGTFNTSNSVVRNEGRAIWVFNTDDQTTPLALDRFVDDIESDRNDNWFMYRATLTVTFRGDGTGLGDTVDALESISVPVGFSATTYRSSDLHINQAIKAAINTDPVLKGLLRAEDGPANSLVVRSLGDGVFDTDDLVFDIVLPDVSKLTDVEAKKVATAWRGLVEVGSDAWNDLDAITTSADAADDLVAFMESSGGDGSYEFTHESFDTVDSQGYDTAMGVALFDDDADNTTAPVATDLVGANSTVTTTDNTIEGGAGDDVIMLSTTDDLASTLGSSNETIKYTAAFGNDTIVNFQEDDGGAVFFGDDRLDFTAIGGFGSAGINNLVGAIDETDIGDGPDGGIIIHLEVDDDAFDDIDAAFVESLFDDNDLDIDVDDVDNDGDVAEDLDQETYVYVAVDSHNVGHVWSIVDQDGDAGDKVDVTFLGTIDLADTDWTLLLDTNFVG